MGEIVTLSFARRKKHHRASAKAGTGSPRAAKAVRRSAVTPASRATPVAVIDCHHSEGMRPRCDHLRMAVTGAPISDAMASYLGQSAITSRNDVGAVMDSFLGPFVLFGKPKVSYDCELSMGQNLPMAKDGSKTAFKQQFIDRVRAARVARDLTQDGIAELLDIPQDKYKQYEKRSYLPHDLVPRFLLATGVDYPWLFTGRGAGPNVAEMLQKAAKNSPRPKRRKAA